MTPTRGRDAMATPTDSDPDLPDVDMLTRQEAADRAGVHYNTIRLWESQRRLTPARVKVGRREEVRIRADQLDELVAARDAEQPARAAAKAGALAIPADQLWGMVQQAGADLAEALEAKARAEVEAAMRAQALEREQDRASRAEARVDELVSAIAAMTPAPAASKHWWQRAPK